MGGAAGSGDDARRCRKCERAYVCVRACAYLHACVFVCARVRVRVRAFVCVCACLHVRVKEIVSIIVCMCACAFVTGVWQMPPAPRALRARTKKITECPPPPIRLAPSVTPSPHLHPSPFWG